MTLVEEEKAAGPPEWMVTFSDMMTLLLTFFVMLVAMSEIKQEESLVLIEALHRQFGQERAPLSLVPGRLPPTSAALNKLVSLGRARRMDTMKGGDKVRAPEGDYPRVRAIRPAGDSNLGGVIYFEEGSSQLTEKHQRTLHEIAQIIGGKPQKIEISGHTSPRPLSPDSPYRSHLDLAYARCFKVMERLVALGIDPERIQFRVVGANEPIHVGYDELLRKKNARVEIIMLPRLTGHLHKANKQGANKTAPGGTP
jgi:chemotaxis protein MotB